MKNNNLVLERVKDSKMLNINNENELRTITTEIVNETKKILKEDVYKIVLYGSCARGDFNSESDIDIMIVMNCRKEEVSRHRKQISKIASRIGLKNDIEISLLLRDKDTFEQGRDVLPFYKNIQREGVSLYG